MRRSASAGPVTECHPYDHTVTRRAALASIAALTCLLAGCSSSMRWEPSLPRAEAGLFEAAPGSLGGLGSVGTTPADGRLITPHSAQQVTATWTTRTVQPRYDFPVEEQSRAAEGEEFLLVDLTARDLTSPYSPEGAEVAMAVVVDGTPRPVELYGGYSDTTDEYLQPDAHLFLSVPVGAPVLLSVTDAERTASIDLRTGERVADEGTLAGEAYYRPRSDQLAGEASAPGVLTSAEFQPLPCTVTISWDDERAFFSTQPWTPSQGWAPAGRIWGQAQLAVEFDLDLLVALDVDPAQVFTVTPAGGQPVRALPGTSSVSDQAYSFEAALVIGRFDLPADFTTGTIDVVLDGRYAIGDTLLAGGPAPSLTGVPVDLGA